MMKAATTPEWAAIYLERGWQPVPIPRGVKGPVTKGWQRLRFATREEIFKTFRSGGNVGLILGAPSHNLIDVDCDSPATVLLAKTWLPPTRMIHGRPSNPSSHYWYQVDIETRVESFLDPETKKKLIELRGSGGQTIVPPSWNAQEQLSWEVYEEPVRVPLRDLRAAVARVAAGALAAARMSPGHRHDPALALAGFLCRVGMSLSSALGFMEGVAGACGADWRDVRASVTTTYETVAAGKPATGGPTLAQMWSSKVVEQLTRWLGLELRTDRRNARRSIADKLLDIALRSELFHDERRDTYAVLEVGGIRQTTRISSRDFARHLRHTYFKENGVGAGSEAVSSALHVADAKAANEGPLRRLDVRFQHFENEVWIDLCDDRWRAVRVTAEGWEIVDQPPILFRRFSHQHALPDPSRGGDLRRIFDFINLKSEEDQILILAWLVTAPLASIPRPALMLHGIKGSGKSFMAGILRQTIDPSALDGLDLSRDTAELAQTLDHGAVTWFDNITKMRTWQADRLCSAITGGAFAKRQLYTDFDDVLMSFRRTMIMTGINIPTSAPDLLDRMLLIELSPPPLRVEEAELRKQFEDARPTIFGGLLDALVGAFRERPSITVDALPRMADFARWGAAAAEALGYGAKTFLEVYQRNLGRQTDEVLESDPVANAIRGLASSVGEWSGSPSELLQELSSRNPTYLRLNDWPKSAAALGKRLKILQPSLRDAGISIEQRAGRKEGRKIIVRDFAALAHGAKREEM